MSPDQPIVPTVVLEQLGPPETGLWCVPCALPSVQRFHLGYATSTGTHTGVVTVEACTDCGLIQKGTS